MFYQGWRTNRRGRPVPLWYEPACLAVCLVEQRLVETAHGVLRHGVHHDARDELGELCLAGLWVDADNCRVALFVDLAEFGDRARVRQLLESADAGVFVGVDDFLDHVLDAMVDAEVGPVHDGGQVVVLGVAEDVDEVSALDDVANATARLFFEFCHDSNVLGVSQPVNCGNERGLVTHSSERRWRFRGTIPCLYPHS